MPVEPVAMKVSTLIEDDQKDLWQAQDFSQIFRESVTSRNAADYYDYIQSHSGEIIALVDDRSRILGWIGLIPGIDERGRYCTLSGQEVSPEHRRQGIGVRLLDEARGYLQRRRTTRLKFGTSPLLTANASLYITKFGTRYTWNNKIKLADGSPWPYVACECDFTHPVQKPAELAALDIPRISLLDWPGDRPRVNGTLRPVRRAALILPALTRRRLDSLIDNVEDFLDTIFSLLEFLNSQDFGFAWFDRLPGTGEERYYYYLTKSMNILPF
jgi:GNAT superfamily N-acetyltransferase